MDESDGEGIDNTITVVEMLMDYVTGDLVSVADGNDILDNVLDCVHACQFFVNNLK